MRRIFAVISSIICLSLVVSPLYAQEKTIKIQKMPEMISQEKPIYPEEARKAGVTGLVTLSVLIDETGNVTEAKADSCDKPGYGFEKSAVAAALKSKFKPAIADGKPVDIRVSYKVNFALEDKKKK